MDPDLIGYLASGLVLLTFTAKSMLTLRILAILSNFAFICYGIIDSIIPVLCLHLILLPLNVTRFCGPATALLRPPRERVSGTPAHMAWVVTTAGNPVKGAGGSTDQSYLRCASVQ